MTVTTDRTAARQRARAAWADLRDRLATITPSALGRAVLGVVVILVVGGFVVGTWPALLPFVFGGLLAYAVLPVVDALDRIMPRSIAAVASMLAVVAVVIGALVVVLPPLAGALLQLASALPAPAELQVRIDEVLAGLPKSARTIAEPMLLELARVAGNTMSGASTGIDRLVPVVFQAALGVAGAILGLIVLPAWMLTIMTDRRHGTAAIDTRLAGWLRPDFWAVVRMADRAAGTVPARLRRRRSDGRGARLRRPEPVTAGRWPDVPWAAGDRDTGGCPAGRARARAAPRVRAGPPAARRRSAEGTRLPRRVRRCPVPGRGVRRRPASWSAVCASTRPC